MDVSKEIEQLNEKVSALEERIQVQPTIEEISQNVVEIISQKIKKIRIP